MAVTQYIGARYVPKFYENSDGTEEWRAGVEYEPLTIVTYNGNSYTSKKPVPSNIGNPSDNTAYWVSTGNYNQQVEEYRQEVQEYKGDVDELTAAVPGMISGAAYQAQSLAYRRFVFIGDSYAEGYTPDGNVTGWCNIVANKLGLATDQYGIWYRGGAGFIADGQGRNFLGLLNDSSMTSPETVTDVIVAGGYNDKSAAQPAVVAAIATFVARAKVLYPNARVSVGMIGMSANAADVYNISRACRNYIEGAGKAGAAYMNNVQYAMREYFKSFATDGVHANEWGQNRIASAVCDYIRSGSCDIYYAYESCAFTGMDSSNNLNSIACTLNNCILSVSAQNNITISYETAKNYGTCNGQQQVKLGTFSAGYVIGSAYDNFTIPVNTIVRLGASTYKTLPAALTIRGGDLYLTFLAATAAGDGWLTLPNVEYIVIQRFAASFDSLMC